MIKVCGFRDKLPEDAVVINTTSRSKTWSKGLSPFFLGPVDLYGGYVSQNVENAWQFSKVYIDFLNYDALASIEDPLPQEFGLSPEYFVWAKKGWDDTRAHRYPMGKGRKPVYSYWNGRKLNYIEARKAIYCPLYAKAVERSEAFAKLKEEYEKAEKENYTLYLWDFDGRVTDESYEEILNNEKKKMGHAFVLAMILENKRVWENAR